MIQRRLDGTTLELTVGDIARQALFTGAFGYPMEDAAGIALETVAGEVRAHDAVERIRFVLFDEASLADHRRALDGLS